MADSVTRPQHYQAGGIETIEVIRAKLGPAGFGYYCEGNTLKYLTRWRHKGGIEDLRKAGVYLQWLITEVEITPQTDPRKWGPPIDPPETFHGHEAPLPPHLGELISRAEAEEPDHLKAGEAYRPMNPPSGDEE